MLPVITFAIAISQSFRRMLISGAVAQPPGAESTQRATVRAAYKRFDKECSNPAVTLLKLDFLEGRGEDTLHDYLNHRLTRHEAAVNLARIWETAWIPATTNSSGPIPPWPPTPSWPIWRPRPDSVSSTKKRHASRQACPRCVSFLCS